MDEDIRIGIRLARPDDAIAIANIFVDSWRETYAGLLPLNGLLRMSKTEQATTWTKTIRNSNLRSPTLVASDSNSTVYGFASAGPTRDKTLGFESEIYTLYVSPGFTGQGIGLALMSSIFRLFSKANYNGMIIWALSENPSRFFYEAMGGRIVAERQHPLWGGSYREIAYGWNSLELGHSAQRVGRNAEPDDPLE